jgi:hypothetical protein
MVRLAMVSAAPLATKMAPPRPAPPPPPPPPEPPSPPEARALTIVRFWMVALKTDVPFPTKNAR